MEGVLGRAAHGAVGALRKMQHRVGTTAKTGQGHWVSTLYRVSHSDDIKSLVSRCLMRSLIDISATIPASPTQKTDAAASKKVRSPFHAAYLQMLHCWHMSNIIDTVDSDTSHREPIPPKLHRRHVPRSSYRDQEAVRRIRLSGLAHSIPRPVMNATSGFAIFVLPYVGCHGSRVE